MPHIKIILSSTRPGRFGEQVAAWVAEAAKAYAEKAQFSVVDLKEIALPFLDEPQPAMQGVYEHEHTKQWSKVINEADGFIVVTPEYNHSYPPVLKNAIDFLWKEWNYKPVSFVSYGADSGGTRAVEHLRSSMAQVKSFDLYEHVMIANYWAQLDENGIFKPSDKQRQDVDKVLKEAVFWAEKLKTIRDTGITA